LGAIKRRNYKTCDVIGTHTHSLQPSQKILIPEFSTPHNEPCILPTFNTPNFKPSNLSIF
ncbi:MAG: hypothetical protein ACK445_01695, partial [Bacteroidota bacterium]